jgi:hypothetical protein
MFVPLKNAFCISCIESLAFILVITVLQNNACVGSLSSTAVSKNTGFSISATNQCFGYISYNYIYYLEQVLRSGGTSHA